MPRNSLDTLIRYITDYFRKHADRYNLKAESLEVRYILNWGGFVNASFFIKDGEKTLHLKLADLEETQEQLRRWQFFNQILTARYHAPQLLDWIKIPRTPYAGLLVEYIPGKPADFTAQPEVLKGVLDLLSRLHADRDLAAALQELDGEVPSCTDYFLDLYIGRFDEDLVVIANDLPEFVSLKTLDWMMGETRELEGLARDLTAFQHPAGSPTHGDLWTNNILVTRAGDWYIIDWDDLALGDPALEYSIVLGPLWLTGALSLEQAEQMLPDDPDFRQRFRLCLRALLLDQVIDSLADWVESDFSPDHQAEVRAAKEQVHRRSLEMYKKFYE
jgi:fructosamine-3-kinase